VGGSIVVLIEDIPGQDFKEGESRGTNKERKKTSGWSDEKGCRKENKKKD